MMHRTIHNKDDAEAVGKLIAGRTKFPFTVKVTDGASRSLKQNRLYRKWLAEIAEQKGDMTAAEWNGYCKLHYGVPIMRASCADYAETYDRFIKKTYSYEQKLAIMTGDYGWPVTSEMNTKQMKEFLDKVHMEFTAQGVGLTDPDKEKD